jgi:hypothetical protein
VPDFDPRQKALAFQWVDIDMASGKPLAIDAATGRKPTVSSPESIVPIIRVYGVTEEASGLLYCVLSRIGNCALLQYAVLYAS